MVTPFYYPPIGGAEVSAENLAIQLNVRNIHTDVMTFNIDPSWKSFSKVKIRGVDVVGVPALDLHELRLPELVFQIEFIPRRFTYRLKDYDVIHFQNDVDLSFPVFSCLVKRPKVFHCRCPAGMFHLYQRNPLAKRLFRKSAGTYIVISEELVKYLVALGIPEDRIRVIPNGIDTEKFRPSGQKTENMLLFVGRFEPIKGLHVLLKGLEYLTIPIQLVIIGGPSWDHVYSERVLDLIKKARTKTIHKILYLGQLKREQTVQWYQKAAIHVRPDTNAISGGNTAVEAMACETPVIGTGNHVVRNGVNGIIIPPNDSIELAKAIEFLVDNGDSRRRLGAKGRKFVVENFSFDVVMEKIVRLYKEII